MRFRLDSERTCRLWRDRRLGRRHRRREAGCRRKCRHCRHGRSPLHSGCLRLKILRRGEALPLRQKSVRHTGFGVVTADCARHRWCVLAWCLRALIDRKFDLEISTRGAEDISESRIRDTLNQFSDADQGPGWRSPLRQKTLVQLHRDPTGHHHRVKSQFLHRVTFKDRRQPHPERFLLRQPFTLGGFGNQ